MLFKCFQSYFRYMKLLSGKLWNQQKWRSCDFFDKNYNIKFDSFHHTFNMFLPSTLLYFSGTFRGFHALTHAKEEWKCILGKIYKIYHLYVMTYLFNRFLWLYFTFTYEMFIVILQLKDYCGKMQIFWIKLFQVDFPNPNMNSFKL